MDNRNIKRDGDFFSIATKPEQERLNIELCDKCAIQPRCRYARYLNNAPIIAPVKQCKAFVPILSFSVLEGLDLPDFNTFRPHSAWAKRLQLGDIVCLYHTQESRTISMREVKAIYQGEMSEMLAQHAKHNHAIQARASTDPVAELREILIRSMGKNFFNAAETASVIYF